MFLYSQFHSPPPPPLSSPSFPPTHPPITPQIHPIISLSTLLFSLHVTSLSLFHINSSTSSPLLSSFFLTSPDLPLSAQPPFPYLSSYFPFLLFLFFLLSHLSPTHTHIHPLSFTRISFFSSYAHTPLSSTFLLSNHLSTFLLPKNLPNHHLPSPIYLRAQHPYSLFFPSSLTLLPPSFPLALPILISRYTSSQHPLVPPTHPFHITIQSPRYFLSVSLAHTGAISRLLTPAHALRLIFLRGRLFCNI